MIISPAVLRLFAFLVGLCFWAHRPLDPDLGWHLLGGAWTVQHGAVPRSDFINTFNSRWHDYHWLAQCIMFLLWRTGGFPLLGVGYGILMGSLFYVLMDIILREIRSFTPLRPLVYFAFSSLALSWVASIRPQMFSYLIIALTMRELLARPHRFEQLYLFLFAVLLANMHVYWVFIPCLWFIYRCIPRILGRRGYAARAAWGGLILLSLAPLLSPYGLFQANHDLPSLLMNYGLVYEYLHVPLFLKQNLAELRSSFSMGWAVTALLLMYIGVMTRDLSVMRMLAALPSSCASIIGFLLAADAGKFLGLLAILSTPGLVHNRELRRLLSRPTPRGAPVLLYVLMLGTLCYVVKTFPFLRPEYYSESVGNPDQACRVLARLHLSPKEGVDHVRILTHFNYGGWCRWIIHQSDPSLDYRVTTDNRTQGVPGVHYELAGRLHDLGYDWRDTLRRWSVDGIVIAKIFPLAQLLFLAPSEWRLVHEDEYFAVFLPVAKQERSPER